MERPPVSPRRISLIGPFWPYRGGIAHFLVAMARGLAKRGHAIRTVTFRRQYPETLFPGKTQLDEGPEPTDVPRAPRQLDTLNPLTWVRTARAIWNEGVDVVVFKYWMSFFAPAFGTLARWVRRRGVTVLCVVDNAIPHERRPGDIQMGRYVLGACDGLVVMSEKVQRDVERLGITAPVRYVAHPVYDGFGDPIDKAEAREALGLDPEKPLFLFFGFIRRYKGLHVLLDAMPSVVDRQPDARLVVAGEFYADEDEIRAQAVPLGDAVRLDTDYIPDDRVALYFSAADAVVQPYVTATQSGVAQIAFHFGRPVITTDVGGLAEIVPDGEAGLVVPPEAPAELANAMVRFIEEDLGDALAEGVQRERVKYSWDRLFEAMEDLIEETGAS
ncbi:MAG: glycosyltransferase [Bacteroidota bacterium]